MRAQPGRRGYGGESTYSGYSSQYIPSTGSGQGTLDRRSAPVGGHLRAIDVKSLQQPGTVGPVVLPPPSVPSQPYYREPQPPTATQPGTVGPVALPPPSVPSQPYYREPHASTDTMTGSYLPRQAPTDRSQTTQMPRGVTPTLANPWERERREEEKRHQELEQRRRRDEEIAMLESHAQQLTGAEADRLRRLKLNAEFERRAMEVEQRSDLSQAGNDTDMTPAGRAKVVHYLQQEVDERRRQLIEDQRDRQFISERQRQYADDYYRQQQRSDVDPSVTGQYQHPVRYQRPADMSSRYERNMNNNNANNIAVPAPPERSSSYNLYQTSAGPQPPPAGPQSQSTVNRPPASSSAGPQPPQQSMPLGPPPPAGSIKKSVSFHTDVVVNDDSSRSPSPGTNSRTWYPVEDNSSLSHDAPPSSGVMYPGDRPTADRSSGPGGLVAPSTPGVVGAQELYPDRGRMARVGTSQQVTVTPERMSFRDKMRHFAAEAGEDSPVERAKISRAQQRIEVASGQ
jgi:hypothetical protein